MTSSTLASAITDGTGWKSTALTPGARYLDFYVDYDCYVAVTKDTDSGPTENGAKYTAGVTHRIPCHGAHGVHHKRVGSSNATLYATCLVGPKE
jgi:hypothetical protein